MDKTGTLTEGQPRLVRIHTTIPEKILSLRKMFGVIGSAESHSEHPIAISITSFVKEVSISYICKCQYKFYANIEYRKIPSLFHLLFPCKKNKRFFQSSATTCCDVLSSHTKFLKCLEHRMTFEISDFCFRLQWLNTTEWACVHRFRVSPGNGLSCEVTNVKEMLLTCSGTDGQAERSRQTIKLRAGEVDVIRKINYGKLQFCEVLK